MKNKALSYLSNSLLIVGVGIGIYVLANIFIVARSLPIGSSPITNNRALIIFDIIVLLTSLVLSFFEKKAPADR